MNEQAIAYADPQNPAMPPSDDDIVAGIIGDTVDSMERLRLLTQEAYRLSHSMVNTPWTAIAKESPERLLACTSAAVNLLYAIKTAGA